MFTASSFPKISCLLITAGGRFLLASRSIRCFLDQTYPNKELVIVNDGPAEYQQQLESLVQGRENVRCVWLKGRYTLGGLRNIAVTLASGDLICQWDDDDFCVPQRLCTQYAYLHKRPWGKVCYLGDQLHYYFITSTLYWDNWKDYANNGLKKNSLIPGTLMCYKSVWNDWQVRYPSSGECCAAGEDSVVSEQFLDHDVDSVLIYAGVGYLHVYTHHGVNQVYDLEHHSIISRMRSHYRSHIVSHKYQICNTLDYLQLNNEVKVMCRDGLVFNYRSANVTTV